MRRTPVCPPCRYLSCLDFIVLDELGYSPNTVRAYRADMEVFERWCESNEFQALPAAPETVAAFIADKAQDNSAATLKRRLAAIRKIHRLLRMENPVTDEEVTIAMRRALRAKCARPQQALGLTRLLRDSLIAACPQNLTGRRDRAVIALGYDTLCRRAELVALRIEDIIPTEKNSAQILVRRSKSDPYGSGRIAYVSPQTLNAVRAWLEAAGIENGFIFRSVSNERVGRSALHPYTINRILKKVARAAGLAENTVEHLSGHSMRVGAAQDMIASGLSILPIMQAGGWKTVNVVSRYVENANLSILLEGTRSGQNP